MLEFINGCEGKIVFSHNEYGYQEVLEDFMNAEWIYILTYSLPKNNQNELFERLKSAIGEVRFYSGIPSYNYNSDKSPVKKS
ncbi:hypothetical protein [Ureibacillus endophyticus]|uniref:Uncharacterized protein n=1 Tax=Ureibacillus endophyticus TaxID=1978490 RepID=A0A494YS95_9BACL|nr:hypothetical protein [Lysinibacillus endophyticus]RKQ12770.1 hypothetical protein D8M03_16805 [Lysinibacillus endophyticus]